MYRVTLYVDGRGLDLALPGDVPVGALMPALGDALHDAGVDRPLPHLAVPGRGLLDVELTLAGNGIRDGDVLLTTSAGVPARVPAVVDAAVAVASARPSATWWGRPVVARRMGLTVATVMAGVTGFLVVPGGPGLADVLLAAAATSVMAVVTVLVAGDSSGAGSAVACLALLCTTAALAATLFGHGIADAGVILTATSVSLLTVSSRVVVRVHGLAAIDEHLLAARAAAARTSMGGLVGGAAAGAALGVVAAGGGGASWSRCAFVAAVAAVLLLRMRRHPDPLTAGALLMSAMICWATFLVILDRQLVSLTWMVCLLTASVGAVAVWLGVHPAEMSVAPGFRRLMDALEHLLLVVLVPLACWTLDVYELVR
ncbi:type VII secretion integral membrane protein EccD [soil metagenome]